MKFRLLLSSFLLANALTVQANDRWFEVEMIVFERTGSSSIKEHFPNQVTPIRLGRHIDLLTDKFYLPLPLDPNCLAPENGEDNESVSATSDVSAVCAPPVTAETVSSDINGEAGAAPETPHQYWPLQLPVKIFGEGLHQPEPYLADEAAFQLNDVVSRLNRQRQHQVVLHTVWRQAPVTERRAIPSRWFAGTNFSQQFDYWGQPLKTEQENSTGYVAEATETDLMAQISSRQQQLAAGVALNQTQDSADEQQRQAESAVNLPSQVWQLDGLFKLHLDRYLFVNTDFNLRQLQNGTLQNVNVKQSRRLISGEIHYLDHPKLGIVLQIRRYDPPATVIQPAGSE